MISAKSSVFLRAVSQKSGTPTTEDGRKAVKQQAVTGQGLSDK